MKIIYAYTKHLGFVKVPIDTLEEFKQTYKEHKVLTYDEWKHRHNTNLAI